VIVSAFLQRLSIQARSGWVGCLAGKDLRGCRSISVARNLRIIFVVCEECRCVPECRFCFCEGLPDKAVVILTVGPHEQAYAMREEPEEYKTQAGGMGERSRQGKDHATLYHPDSDIPG
jgi:hypothetical protein